jgi:glycopeptide antibiotics resistance protein
MVATGWVLVMVLRPDPTPNTINLVPLHDRLLALRCLLAGCPAARQAARFLFFETLGNVAVFVPIGLSLAGALHGLSGPRRVWIAIAAGAALSIGIELAQLAVPSRATDVDDVLLNTLGAALGAVFIVRSRR